MLRNVDIYELISMSDEAKWLPKFDHFVGGLFCNLMRPQKVGRGVAALTLRSGYVWQIG